MATGTNLIPQSICVDLIDRCNLQCEMCDRQRWFHANEERQSLDYVHWRMIFEDAKRLGIKDILLTGGEPFLHPHIKTICEDACKNFLSVDLITNGDLLGKHVHWLKKLPITIHVSVDGAPSAHDTIRDRQDAFIELREAVGYMVGGKAHTRVNCVIRENNITTLPYLAQNLLPGMVDVLSYQHQSFCPRDIKQETIDKERHYLMENKSTVQFLPERALSPEKIQELLDIFKYLLPSDFISTIFVPAIPISDVIKYYQDWEYHPNHLKLLDDHCPALWRSMRLSPDGQATMCGWFLHEMGDVFQDGVKAVWNGEKANSFRKIIEEVKYFPGCRRCCAIN